MPTSIVLPGRDARTGGEPGSRYYLHGVIAGLIGAFVVAVFFLILDIEAGRPLRTPHVLGSWLFRGELPPPGAAPEMPLVWGYTVAHGVVFAGFGLMAAFEALAGRLRLRHEFVAAAIAAIVLFVAFELVFGVLGALFTPLMGELGSGRVAAANALAALSIAGYLASVRARSRQAAVA